MLEADSQPGRTADPVLSVDPHDIGSGSVQSEEEIVLRQRKSTTEKGKGHFACRLSDSTEQEQMFVQSVV